MSPTKQPYRFSNHAKEMRKRHGDPLYVMVWLHVLVKMSRDERLHPQLRYFCTMWVLSWGHFSDYVVSENPKTKEYDPEPVAWGSNQTAMWAGMPASTFNE